MVDIKELQEPIEVYKLEEDDREAIIKLLRSDKPLTRWFRNCLADWLEGKRVRPVKIGRPRGVDPRLKVAKYDYQKLAAKLNSRKCFYGRSEWLIEKLSDRYGLDPRTLANFIKRSK